MLEDAINAGFTENEVEILTEEEVSSKALLKLEPKPIQEPTTEQFTNGIQYRFRL